MSRNYCPNCEKATAACFCHKLHQYSIDSQIIILRHPSEKGHPLGTAKIAELSLDNCKVITAEEFKNNLELTQAIKDHESYLVFPTQNEQPSRPINESTKKKLYIFIDGTWKKAKKILYMNPFLNDLPTISLTPSDRSKYILRKVPKDNYISTLEAICECLRQYDDKDISGTLNTLKHIQDFQIQKMGIEKFNQIYSED